MLTEQYVILELDGKAYPLAYNLNVMERVDEHFKGLENLGLAFIGGSEGTRHQKWLLTAMINEGIDIQNDDGKGRPILTEKQVGRMIRTVEDWNRATQRMLEAIGAAGPEGEGSAKNERATQGQ